MRKASDFTLSAHAHTRSIQRNVAKDELEFIVKYGTRVRRSGVIFCQLRKIDLPDDIPRNSKLRRMVGATAVLSSCGDYVLTVYRNERAFRKDNKKAKFRRRSQAQQDHGYYDIA